MVHRRLIILICLVFTLSAVSFTMSMAENDMSSDLVKPDTPPGQGEDEYTAGFGLILDQFEFSVDTETVQSRIVNNCLEGESIQQVNQDGSVICEPDDDTLDSMSCSSNQVLKYDGVAWICADDAVGSSSSYQNVVVVAKNNGDYTSVQAAIDSITDASAVNPYLVWIAPGVYDEQVTMKSFVHLQGAGQEITIISSTATNNDYTPTQATIVMVGNTSLSEMTVNNSGDGYYNVAILAASGTTGTLIANVTVNEEGNGYSNAAIWLDGGTGVTLQQITALAKNASFSNDGLSIDNSSVATLKGGSYTGQGGDFARGIWSGNYSTLDCENVTAIGEDGLRLSVGLYNIAYAEASLHSSSFIGHGGNDDVIGIENYTYSKLVADNINALADGSGTSHYGLKNHIGAEAKLLNSSFTGRGGSAYGIFNYGPNSILDANYVTSVGDNYGFFNYEGATSNLTQCLLEGVSYSAYNHSGPITISNSRLVGGAVYGSVTCVLVTRGTGVGSVSADGSTCP